MTLPKDPLPSLVSCTLSSYVSLTPADTDHGSDVLGAVAAVPTNCALARFAMSIVKFNARKSCLVGLI